MRLTKLTRRMFRPARDFVLGLGLFGAVAAPGMVGTSVLPGSFVGAAHAELLSLEGASVPLALADPAQNLTLLIVLALVSAGLFAFNIWFVRHLRRAYAAPRRR